MTENPNSEQHTGSEDQYRQPAYERPVYDPQGHQQPAQYGYGQVPAASTQTDRNWAAASHWGTLVAAWVAMGFLAPLLIMLTVGNQSPFVRRHAVESLNFQISLLIYGAVAVVFSIITIGLGLLIVIPAALVVLVAALVFLIKASVKASNG